MNGPPSVAPEPAPVEVRLLDKAYLVACPPEERQGLLEAARLLDERLRGMRQANRAAPLERIAVLAALNLAHERLQAQTLLRSQDEMLAKLLSDVDQRISAVLDAPAPR